MRPSLGGAALAAVFASLSLAFAEGACSSDAATATPKATEDAGDASTADTGSTEDAGTDASTPPPDPTSSDIAFKARAALPAGELLVFDDWSKDPNGLYVSKPDGSAQTLIFEAKRVWSFGVSHDRKTIAFACEDPFAGRGCGFRFSDAFQNRWVYDVAGWRATLLSKGNVNDECHMFGPGDKELFVCRRYDFTKDGKFKGWRLAKTDLASGSFSFLTPEETTITYRLDPNVTPDGQSMISTRLVVTPPSSQTYAIEKRSPISGTASVLLADAGRVRLSPDGTKMVFTNYADARKLYVKAVDGASPAVKVLDAEASRPVFSPDGLRVAYLVDDKTANCQHIEIVKADGSDAASPTRVHDCATAKDFITALAWIAP